MTLTLSLTHIKDPPKYLRQKRAQSNINHLSELQTTLLLYFSKRNCLRVRQQLLTAGGAHGIFISATGRLMTMTSAQAHGSVQVLLNTHRKVNTSIKRIW